MEEDFKVVQTNFISCPLVDYLCKFCFFSQSDLVHNKDTEVKLSLLIAPLELMFAPDHCEQTALKCLRDFLVNNDSLWPCFSLISADFTPPGSASRIRIKEPIKC
jgi:hypothetical protein